MSQSVSTVCSEDCYQLHNLTLLRDDGSELLSVPDSKILAGKFTCISGVSGAGKSSLLLALAGLNFNYTGQISYCSRGVNKPSANDRGCKDKVGYAHKSVTLSLRTLSDKNLTSYRQQNIGFVFQQHQLINELSVFANTTIPANWVVQKQRLPIEEHAARLLEQLAISDIGRLSSTCSGGEQQRISVARALVCNPDVVLADEPTASLDAANRSRLIDVMLEKTINRNLTLIACSHDEAMIEAADHLWHLEDGVLEHVR